MKASLPNHYVYQPAVIEFISIAAETCLLLEQLSGQTLTSFVDQSLKLLPTLYLKAQSTEIPPRALDEEDIERFVTEEDYNYVKEGVMNLLGNEDSYLEVFHPDMPFSDTPVVAFVSENLADIYQELKDLAANYRLAREDVMNDALVLCLEAFSEHWGQKLLNALRALHSLRYSAAWQDIEVLRSESPSLYGNNFADDF